MRTDEVRCGSCGVEVGFTVSSLETDQRDETIVPPAQINFFPGHIFADRFTIIERIGAGGMGVVYKAIDTALNCDVALKLIQPVLAGNASYARRFRDEVRITRQITHPNIGRVHDIGLADGVLYLSMEWIQGETLQALLRQAVTLKESRALEFTEKIAMALEAAHARGVVHRDLKPANVMIDRRGNTFVLDFGLAIQVDDRTTGTKKSKKIGTPLYMSPEQRKSEALDGRSDLYALGLILREMLTGRRSNPEHEDPADLPPEIDSMLRPLLRGLLAEDPADRFASAPDVQREIHRLLEHSAFASATPSESHLSSDAPSRRRAVLWSLAAALLIGATAIGIAMLGSNGESWHPDARVFYDRGMQYLREDAESVRSIDMALQQFNRALNHEPEQPVIHAALAETYWLRYERSRNEAARDEAERAIRKTAELDPELPLLPYVRALGFINEGKFDAAKQQLLLAIDGDPEFAPAWSQLGYVEQHLGNYKEAHAAHEEAIRLAPGNFRAHLYSGVMHEHFAEYTDAARSARKATELKPDSLTAWANLAAAHLHLGNHGQAIEALQQQLELENTPVGRSNLGTVFYELGQYAEAAAEYEIARGLAPDEPVFSGNLGDALLMLKDESGAAAAYARAAELAEERVLREPVNPVALMEAAHYCAQAGRFDCAEQHAAALLDIQPDGPMALLTYSAVQSMIGRDAAALEHLERAVKLGVSKAQIELLPAFDRLRDDPRYIATLSLSD
ncbi:MAG: protein kinase [bacterium]|nr:protein kinase [bacterium]